MVIVRNIKHLTFIAIRSRNLHQWVEPIGYPQLHNMSTRCGCLSIYDRPLGHVQVFFKFKQE